MDESITITKTELQTALARWEQDHRDGKCRPYEEGRALPAEQVVQESTDCLWGALVDKLPPPTISRDEMTGEQLRAAHEA